MVNVLREINLLAMSSSDDRIDVICDIFEGAWIRGESPDLVAFLTDAPASDSTTLFTELLYLDVEYRRRSGETPTKTEYLNRFPEMTALVESAGFVLNLGNSVTIKSDSESRNNLPPALRIGCFALIEKVGTGASGEVWKALDEKLQRVVAIKLPHTDDLGEDEVRRFLQEARASASLSHPNIVTVHEVGRDGDVPYIVSDFITGKDLLTQLCTERQFPNGAASFCATVADALHHAHEMGLVHRDLKPANILLDDANLPYITDFGLAKRLNDTHPNGLSGRLIGTPAYMSPEQARGETSDVDHRSDVFALGVILYELLTGERPFKGDEESILVAIVNDDPIRPRLLNSAVPRDLEIICLKALEKRPGNRYQTALEMCVDLRRFLNDQPISARTTGTFEKLLRWTRRHPATAAAVLLASLAVGSIAVAKNSMDRTRQLIGMRAISLATEPSGAEIVLVPLSEQDGEPVPSKIIRAGVSPIELDVEPANYLVIAVLKGSDRDKPRFHEVYRHVPRSPEAARLAYNHLFWETSKSGVIALPKVYIPSADITNDMVLFVDDAQASRSPTSAASPFYMDVAKFTYGKYTQAINNGLATRSLLNNPKADSAAKTVTFDQAVMYAELMGKRLPTHQEYQIAMKLTADQRMSDNGSARSSLLHSADSLNMPHGTRQITEGIYSEPREWTTTWKLPTRVPGNISILNEVAQASQYRIIWPPANTLPLQIANLHGPIDSLDRSKGARTVGFRCVRSAAPRYWE